METISVNGVRLAYEETGSGPAVIWVHGGWTDRRDAELIVPPLADRYRMIVYDRRGHSDSERPQGHQSVTDHVDDLGALIEGLGSAPARLVTNSFGGEIALKLALRRPELVAGLCLHEPSLFGLLTGDPEGKQMLGDLQQGFGAVLTEIEQGRPEAAARRFVDTVVVVPGGWDALPERVRATIPYNAPTVVNDLRDPDPDLGVIDLDRLAELDLPVLLTEGGRSDAWTSVVNEHLAGALPNVRRHEIAEAGHVPQFTHPEELAATVRAFLEGIASARI